MRRLAATFALLFGSPALALELPAWLAGHWQTRGGQTTTEEVWLAPADGLMTGMSRTSGGKKPFFEFARLEQRGGKLLYIAQPGGAAPTEFSLTASDAESFRAENPGHDFPQRIIYERRGNDGIDARIEGDIDGKPQVQHWQYFRVR
ncbi:hypothetical protein DFR29_11973 [Tahibacter aquaticus]|uniref:DUF6265 domain-containing protein n=1 Tax=Tahibacter aquaticus TaxID=520092 RepID=A0A4R6YMP1_9GAMM|nr:DUF6265 family protein [Tahibacter aquaticus]TDR38745.1 hypothetical protein DFR29_11973 [Tahibacter aquaticus]